MNKEELLEHINKTNKHNNSDGLYDYMKREIERLNKYVSFYEDLSKKQNKEIERLKKQSNYYAKRIINALDYINKHAYSNISKSYDELYNGQIEELVNILEGSEQNEKE